MQQDYPNLFEQRKDVQNKSRQKIGQAKEYTE